MFFDILYTIIFLIGVFYLINYRLNIKKAAEQSGEALYPKHKDEFQTILIPAEWKEMKHLSKDTKSYKYVHWGTIIAFVVVTALFLFFLSTDRFDPSFFNIIYLFVVIVTAIKHPGNLYILPKGIILNGKYYSTNQIESYETEQIIRWHQLYGLDSRLNFAYQLQIKIKRSLFQPNYLVIEDQEHLEKIINLLNQQGIYGTDLTEKKADTISK